MSFSRFLPLPVVFVAPALLSAATPAWPGSKEDLAAAGAKPSEELAVSFRKQSDAAFDKKLFPDSVALRKLSRLESFLAKYPVTPELSTWLIANRDVSEEFIGLLSRYDDPKAVSEILSGLWKADDKGFRAYPRLACAIALVYDRPAPAGFPHHQVSEKALPRKLNAPAEVFAFFKESAEARRLARQPDKLGIDELAYVVSFVTPLTEMREAQKTRIGGNDLGKLYASIKYDHARFEQRKYDWPLQSYSLETIRSKGGICVDQAYYTASTAQAAGIPAFILSGVGSDGFHAFVGFLERPGKWKTDVGRYAEQKFASGTAINPLTWGELTDHDLAFLQERFQDTPNYAITLLHVEKAREAIAAKDYATADKLLATARAAEPRCPGVWNALAELADKRGDDPDKCAKLYGDAAKAMERFREAEVEWRYRLAAVLDKQGKTEAAFAERETIVQRNVRTRPDLAVVLAAQMMDTVVKAGDPKRELQVFNRLVNRFDEAGTEFFVRVVYPFQTHLLKNGLKKEAQQVARTVTQRFKSEKGGQLEEMQKEISAWAASGSVGTSAFYHPRPENAKSE